MLFPEIPNTHAAATMALTVIALISFSREKIPLESSCPAILAALTVGFEVFPMVAGSRSINGLSFFPGFAHEALVAYTA